MLHPRRHNTALLIWAASQRNPAHFGTAAVFALDRVVVSDAHEIL
jgi:hypothetical protein